MHLESETNQNLIAELEHLRSRVAELEKHEREWEQLSGKLNLHDKRLKIIEEITSTVVGEINLEEKAEMLTTMVCRAFDVDTCVIRILKNNSLQLLGASGVPPGVELHREMTADWGISSEILQKKQPLFMKDVYSHPVTAPYAEKKGKDLQFKSYAGAPLMVREQILGVLGIYSIGKMREFNDTDLEHLRIIANHVANIINNNQLYEELINRRDQLLIQIKERRKAEENLRESENHYRSLFEISPASIMLEDANGKILDVNPTFCSIFGRTREEIIGNNIREFTLPEDEAEVEENISRILSGEKMHHVVKNRTKDGREIFMELFETRINLPGGKRGVLVVANDITERILSERERVQLQNQLFQSQKMEAVGNLAAGVAHDFNNLLTAISGYAEKVLLTLENSDPHYINISHINEAAWKAADLTRKLLAFGRKQPLEFKPMNINHRIESMLRIMERLMGEQIVIDSVLRPNLWTVRADPSSVDQVIMNLVVNARDSMDNKGTITVRTDNINLTQKDCRYLTEARPGKYVRILVADSGKGMNRETLEHIFEPFFTTKESGKGTGLGMAVVYGIVKQHGGWVNVESEPDQGTEFSIYFPVVSGKSSTKDGSELSWDDLEGSGERVLFVEDEPVIMEFAVSVLRENGYKVIEAAGVEEAEKVFHKQGGDFDVVFCDIVLPDGTGPDLVNRLRNDKPDLRVILTSGYAENQTHWKEIRENGYRFIHKPYGLVNLLRVIKGLPVS